MYLSTWRCSDAASTPASNRLSGTAAPLMRQGSVVNGEIVGRFEYMLPAQRKRTLIKCGYTV